MNSLESNQTTERCKFKYKHIPVNPPIRKWPQIMSLQEQTHYTTRVTRSWEDERLERKLLLALLWYKLCMVHLLRIVALRLKQRGQKDNSRGVRGKARRLRPYYVFVPNLTMLLEDLTLQLDSLSVVRECLAIPHRTMALRPMQNEAARRLVEEQWQSKS
ncbi:hypothetical protein J6590_020555 [Homalodisca vitripennis]|nr:hypothetical protein J6590_020555 [Homalodisca vitripennis]